MKRLQMLTILLALALVAGACGQKSGVAGSTAGGSLTAGGGDVDAGEGLVPSDGSAVVDGGAVIDPSTGAPTDGSVASPTDGGGATPGGGGGGATPAAPGGGGNSGPAAPSGPVDRTGVSDKEIVIGIHAPVTGAAPFPQNSFDSGKDVYWEFLKGKGGVLGRNVRVVFRDDEFNPSVAVRVCREMVEKEKVFLLIGGGGADQITACAKYANSVGVPYLSPGVNETDLNTLKTYFAVSMTYKQQSPMLAQLAKNRIKKTKIGVVVSDTPSFGDAKSSFIEAAKGQGLEVVYQKPYPKNANQNDALNTARELQASGAEAVYFLGSPVTWIYLAQAGQSQGYTPTYFGPGISNGLNAAAEFGCPGINGANYLSPFPQLDAIDSMDPDYQKAYQAQNGSAGDDIGIALWGIAKTLGVIFNANGKDLSRQSFMATMESGKQFASGVFPPLSYGPGRHFGSGQAHLLVADCNDQQYKTAARFVSGF